MSVEGDEMSSDRTTRRPTDPRKTAEALFKKAPPQPVAPAGRAAAPGARELVSLRIDSAVLEHFQAQGPGWQDRINEALRQTAGLNGEDSLTPAELNSSNDG